MKVTLRLVHCGLMELTWSFHVKCFGLFVFEGQVCFAISHRYFSPCEQGTGDLMTALLLGWSYVSIFSSQSQF
jgi:hypothetical protein